MGGLWEYCSVDWVGTIGIVFFYALPGFEGLPFAQLDTYKFPGSVSPVEAIALLGAYGWELVTVFPYEGKDGSQGGKIFYFKRPIETGRLITDAFPQKG